MLADARVGTSGFAYREWTGHVYPRGAEPSQFLSLYAQRLPAVEIVSTHTRMPPPEVLDSWAATAPAGFQFALKAPNRIGMELGLGKNPVRSMAAFLEAADRLGDTLGPVLIHVPESGTADRRALAAFLDALPEGLRVAFELGRRALRDDATLRLLSAHDAALVLADEGEGAPRIELTASFTYVRIRRDDDRPEAIDEWAERLGGLARRGVDVYAFVKQDRRGLAVDRAMRLATLLRAESEIGEQAMLS